jgi:cytochrome P450
MESRQVDEFEEQDPFSSMDPEMAANPQPVFKVMRDTMPVMPIDGLGVVITKRADVEKVLRHPEVFSSNIDAVDLKNVRPLIPLQIDPPEHKKFRRLLDPMFAPRKVALLEERLTAAANELIDAFIDRGTVDFAEEFSTKFPTRVFLNVLGLPEKELPRFLAMKSGIIRPNLVTGKPYGSREAQELQKKSADSIYEYFNAVLDEREVERSDDLLSAFLDATVDDLRLTREDILDICFLFLIAGLDTVTATLDCMFGYLATHPEQRKQIADDPSIIPTAMEEMLRWETPVMGIVRVALEDAELGGCPVRKDDRVMVMLGSVNTDETDLADADVVRFDRTENRHLAFGGGVHRCLGSNLARLELKVALREWHRRIPEYQVADGHELVYTPSIRSIDYFPMVFTAVP